MALVFFVKASFHQIWVTSREILKVNKPYNYDNNNTIATKAVNGTDKTRIILPKTFGQLNFRTQLCPKTKNAQNFLQLIYIYFCEF